METIKKHKKELLVLLGASVAAALGYLALKSGRKGSRGRKSSQEEEDRQADFRKSEGQARQEETKGESSFLSPLADNPSLEVKQNAQIIIQRAGGYLTKDSVVSILSAILAETKKHLESISRKNREDRRQVFENQEEYARVYQEFIEEFNNLINEVTERICQQNGISSDDYMQSFEYLIKTGNKDLMMLQASIAQLMKGSITPTKSLTKPQVVEAITYQCDLTKVEMQKLFSDPSIGMMMMQAPEIVMGLLQARVADMVFQRFGYEEEDIVESISANNLQDDPEIRDIFQQLAQGLMQFMPMDPSMMMQGGGMM
eukprot:TRINITY_DN196_c0_g2_i1.p1 TRINITY_DN196_c0_g2~~TRINITY_DN196_c0_g2_i1.p1  ORF type:complete len:314 (+),score=89.04 TRINITY_DN196_c0_g2_i1:40-981(+)